VSNFEQCGSDLLSASDLKGTFLMWGFADTTADSPLGRAWVSVTHGDIPTLTSALFYASNYSPLDTQNRFCGGRWDCDTGTRRFLPSAGLRV
jgi:hypothetical protein